MRVIETNQYANIAGIFKPPHELLYGNHKNIAIMFHGFIAHVAKGLGKRVYHIADPAPSMAELFEVAFKHGYRGVHATMNDLYGDIDGRTHVDKDYELDRFHRVNADTAALEKCFLMSN